MKFKEMGIFISFDVRKKKKMIFYVVLVLFKTADYLRREYRTRKVCPPGGSF